jgi:hypothetical protein
MEEWKREMNKTEKNITRKPPKANKRKERSQA